ncbi:2'-5' RNA ligase family protein [Arthrobacter tecti]
MYSLELFFDPELDAGVRSIWRELNEQELSSLETRSHRRHVPHVSLAVGPHLNELDSAALAGFRPPRRVDFDAVATFAGPGGVVFLSVRPSMDFLEYHQSVFRSFPTAVVDGLWEYYLPGRLTPHCTLALDVPTGAIGHAIDVAKAHLPLSGRYAGVNLVTLATGESRSLESF